MRTANDNNAAFIDTFDLSARLATIASAQGVIVPGPCRRCPDPPTRPAPARPPHQVDQDRHEDQFASRDDARRTGIPQQHGRDTGRHISLSDSRIGVDSRVCDLGRRSASGR